MPANTQLEHRLVSTRAVLETYIGRVLPDWEQFARGTELVTVERGEVLVPSHTHHPFAYHVVRGMLKLQVSDGRIGRTVALIGENEFATCWTGLGMASYARVAARIVPHQRADPRLRPEGSPYSLVAIEPTTVLRATTTTVEALAERHHAWSILLSTVLATSIVRITAAVPEMHLTSPEERYRSIRARRPDLVERISQRELAAHLGVTEVGMSRIVRRVAAQLAAAEPGA
ncbi:Crp/Fnr family transcriptional regulator [Litorihabitans aurantiacus]|uniref:Crp/Fnr family transcriptional regulator n=1 Tax=Litorihabitans aurantiacus TaxID=1930061 RepID=A0AA37XGH8_9MICO|nr:hypothetical protein [Litorihabitans aurantiacus]GMA32541.1 hypothetical protein GCM10025875_25330 [Litorihabitans aurantiacus]